MLFKGLVTLTQLIHLEEPNRLMCLKPYPTATHRTEVYHSQREDFTISESYSRNNRKGNSRNTALKFQSYLPKIYTCTYVIKTVERLADALMLRQVQLFCQITLHCLLLPRALAPRLDQWTGSLQMNFFFTQG